MPINPPDDSQSVVSNNLSVSSTPDANSSTLQQTQPVTTPDVSISDGAQNTQQPTMQPDQPPALVSNRPTSPDPAIRHASRFYQFAQALAGGPKFKQSVDVNTGQTQRTPVPLSRGDIGMAIALEAISGALGGLGVKPGPGNVGRAAEAGYQQVAQQQQQAKQQQDQQAQQDLNNQTSALARRASIFETNSRTLLNVSEAEAQGADAIDKLVSINRQSGILDVDPSSLDNAGQPVTQNELLDAMRQNKLSPTDHLGPVAGRVEMRNPDGSKRWEATHLVIRDPSTPVELNQSDWDRYAAAGVPGFPAGTKIGQGIRIPLRMMQNANEVAASHYLANQRLNDLRDALDGTPESNKVPTSIDFTQPGVNTAFQKLQRYLSHNAANLEDPYVALQQMGADKRDPKTGEMQPNPDSKYVSTVADALGGMNLLSVAHDQILARKKMAADYAVIDTVDKANAVLAAPKRFTPDKVQAAKAFINLSNEQGAKKAAEAARARAVAEGSDVEAMFRYGRNPVTGETLSLDNAAPSMLVNSSGQVIPQDLLSTYKPTAQEKQTADTARQVLAISNDLQNELQKNPALAGPLSGRSKQAFAKLGYGDAQAQKFLDDVSFLQSAATKMHTGRFSNEILKKMSGIIKPGMNPDQFTGALSSINSVASRYADEDKLRTVADYKQQINTPANPNPSGAGARQVQIPAGAQIGRDGKGNIVGYRLGGHYYPLTGAQ